MYTLGTLINRQIEIQRLPTRIYAFFFLRQDGSGSRIKMFLSTSNVLFHLISCLKGGPSDLGTKTLQKY